MISQQRIDSSNIKDRGQFLDALASKNVRSGTVEELKSSILLKATTKQTKQQANKAYDTFTEKSERVKIISGFFKTCLFKNCLIGGLIFGAGKSHENFTLHPPGGSLGIVDPSQP